ncbi:MAG: DUF3179 domain-containing protein [Anaerolineae bacterium]|nr:MAG: DUF3179 domain-containing protein [Anaerolineae bacterium]
MDGQVYHFGARGLYNGGLLLGDRETGSYWQHLIGRCVYGPLQGSQLEVFPLLRTNAGQALEAYPNAQIALSRLSLRRRLTVRAQEGVLRLLGGRLPPGFQWTMGREDRRRERMEPGLAVWTDRTQRFYPTETLQAQGSALINELDGQRTVVYVDPTSGVPSCLYTEARHCSWQGDALSLDTGESLRGAILYDAQGTIRAAGRPRQSITCWYTYAFTFPGGEIYEG